MQSASAISATEILGIRIHILSKQEALQAVTLAIEKKNKLYAVTVNPEFVLTAQQDSSFAEILNRADFSFADGIGLVYASWLNRFLNRTSSMLLETIPGVDLVDLLINYAGQKKLAVFFLGGDEGMAEKTARYFQTKYPGLVIAGFFEGNGREAGDNETRQEIAKASNKVGAKIAFLFVAYGHPKQEKWIARNLPFTPVRFAMGVGGAFDIFGGKKGATPSLLRRLGLDWLWRLCLEPSRFMRTFRAVIIFPLTIVFNRR
ncbi:WecB/TagA/CpsF family glycosyltransferase [Candidatus Curtissbacteria bacterium]|nr:WecB/TagA/CpsF family glycosyltransferase [Candidatus Curtissbacteria bacterium]